MFAHRAAHLFGHGYLDPSLDVLHSCDNPICCNPAHLRMGTHLENMADMVQRGRHRNGALAGSHDGRRKSSDEQRAEMTRLYEVGVPISTIAKTYGLAPRTVRGRLKSSGRYIPRVRGSGRIVGI